MRIQYWTDNSPKSEDVEQVVVFDNYGNVLGVFYHIAPDVIEFARLGDPEFDMLMRKLSVKSVEVKEVKYGNNSR